MITKLRCREPSHSTFVPKHKPGGPVEYREKKTAQEGHSEFVPITYESPAAEEDLGFTVLSVRNEQAASLHQMLSWFTGQADIPAVSVVETNGKMTKVKIRGEFAPELPESELWQMMLDYRNLSTIFQNFDELLRPRDAHMVALMHLLHHTAQNLSQIQKALVELGSQEMNKRIKPLPELPKWACRMLEIRKALNR